ncbi:hypothetical protein [Flavobacterium sp.]|uniref:hypothetical protein n=1 Tax=Flavobacterium sp. TaxID=239 RepID=UPI003751BEE1
MKRIVVIFLFFLCISCQKVKYTTEDLFLEELKESSAFYEDEIKSIEASIKVRYEEYGYNSEKFDTLNRINDKIDKLFKDLKTKTLKNKIQYQLNVIQEINNLNSEYKMEVIDTIKLKNLNEEMLFYYLKTKFYKKQYHNYYNHLKGLPIYCGFKQISKKQAELIKIIEDSNIK